MALKPVRVLLPVQLILDCHWLICVRGEGLTDRSIAHTKVPVCAVTCRAEKLNSNFCIWIKQVNKVHEGIYNVQKGFKSHYILTL